MDNSSVQLRHSIKYGAIFGGIIVLMLFMAFITGMLNNKTLTSFSPAIFIIGAYLSVRHFRDKISGGFITFGKAFGTSLITCISIGVIWAIYRFLLFKYLSPPLMDLEIAEMQEIMLNKGNLEKYVEIASAAATPFTMAFGYITNSAFYGSLLSLIIAAILKRNANPLLIDTDQNL